MANLDNNDLHEANDDDNFIGDQFVTLLNSLSQIKTHILSVTNQVKLIEKQVKREFKQNRKEISKRQVKGNRKPSGFAAASPISKDLCAFMGKEVGTSIARTEVTKFICSYIKQHSLTDDTNNKVIKPDNKLKSLLGTSEDTIVTYFNIQRFMNKHFIKDDTILVEVNNTTSN